MELSESVVLFRRRPTAKQTTFVKICNNMTKFVHIHHLLALLISDEGGPEGRILGFFRRMSNHFRPVSGHL
jgi:hypothetical protein